MFVRRFLLAAAFVVAALPAMAADKVHHLALQISDDTPEKMTAVLNVAANVSRHYSEVGEGRGESKSASSPSMPGSTCCAPTSRRCWRG